MNNQDLITQFYTAFAKGDAEGMIACYSDDTLFEDPAFGPLKGIEAKSMWQMLIGRNKGNIKVTFSNVQADANTGSANWEAHYVFGEAKRPVINRISAKFEFKDGKIVKHTDSFDMWTWSSQALGWSGKLLGWSSFLKNKIRQRTKGLLDQYMSERGLR